MKKFKPISLFIIIVLISFFINNYACQEGEQANVNNVNKGQQKEISRTFKARAMVKIQTMSGSCKFKKGKKGEIVVQVFYDPSAGLFEPQMEEDRGTNTLILRDKFQGGDEGSDALWIVTVPEKTGIKATSISGNISAVGLNGQIAAKTVSGDISIRECNGNLRFANVSGVINALDLKGIIQLKGVSSDLMLNRLVGKMEINTASGEIKAAELEGDISCAVASGDIEINKAQGIFKIKTASGDIRVSDISLQGISEFKVTSGDVKVTLGKSPEHDLTLISINGDAVLNYNGLPLKGWFEFKALSGKGDIISPFKFAKEEIEEKWGNKFDVKSFQKDGDSPRIYIQTYSGEAVLKEK